MIRAKFRCMRVSHEWDGKQCAEFRPITRGRGKDPDNDKFWDASPSGEASLTFKGECGFKPGDYYHIDMGPSEDGQWELWSVTRRASGDGEVKYGLPWKEETVGPFQGRLDIGITYPETLALFGDPGKKWAIEFGFADQRVVILLDDIVSPGNILIRKIRTHPALVHH